MVYQETDIAGVVASLEKGLDKSQVAPAQTQEIRDKIFTLESSRGRNVNCPTGKFNGYGYRQNKSEWICYDTQEEVENLVDNWIIDHIEQGLTEQELICHYNTGSLEPCPYYQKYLSL